MTPNGPLHPLETMASEIQASSASHAWQGFGIAHRMNRCHDAVELPRGHSAHLVVVHTAGEERAEQQRGGLLHRGQPQVGQSNVIPAEQGLFWTWRSATPPRSLHLWFEPHFLSTVASDVTGGRVTSPEVEHAFDEDDASLRGLVGAMASCLAEPSWCTLRAESIAYQAATYLMRRYGSLSSPLRHASTRPLDPTRTELVCEYLRQHLASELRIGELARVAGLSRGHFARAFRLATGLTPHRYLLAARLERALERLCEGARPSLVASEVGFADQAHLTRWLRRTIGMTPGQIARVRNVSGRSWHGLSIGSPVGKRSVIVRQDANP